MRRSTVAASVIAILAGCAAPQNQPPMRWYKSGASQQEFDQQAARCRMQLAALPPAPVAPPPRSGDLAAAFNAPIEAQDRAERPARFMRDCMTADGWVLR